MHVKKILPIQKLFIFTFILICNIAYSQKVTKVRGAVYDAKTKEPLPFVDVGFLGTSVGVSTDLDGKFSIDTRFPSDTLFASFLSYKTAYKRIEQETRTSKIIFYLESESIQMETVTILEKKGKYSKKNNPAIDLAKRVRENKYVNSLKGKDYYRYDTQEKVRLDVNNITEKFKKRPFIRNLDFMWDYVDTSEVNGKTYLPLFMKESLSTMHYRKRDNNLKEERHAEKYTELTESIDPETISDVVDMLYQDVDVYEERINLLTNQFVGPFAKAGYDFYRYYILDTTEVNGKSAINLAFIPAIKGNFGFTGNIYVTNDDQYSVLKVDMGIINGINLNFVRDIKISQEFEKSGDSYIKTKDKIIIDYALTENGLGMYGSRTVDYDKFNFEKPEDESIFNALEKVVTAKDAGAHTDEYWEKNRIKPLEKTDQRLYEMVDTMVNDKYFKRYSYVMKVATEGYVPIGGISFGHLLNFVSFNQVEGLNLRLGVENNFDLSKRIRVQGYIARAMKPKIWKYSAGMTFTFKNDWSENPLHYIRARAVRESIFPGQELAFFDPANFFLSFQRDSPTRMLLYDKYELNYRHEMHGFAYHFDIEHNSRKPFGTLTFERGNGLPDLTDITTGEIAAGFRYAPNEQFIQGKDKRRQLYNEYPIITFRAAQGIKGLFGGDYTYTKLNVNLFKQWEWLQTGRTNMLIESGATFGDVPYILQNIPRGNQTYVYELASYNMMNFLEFVTDKNVSLKFDHFWMGYLLNRVPLIKKLELRAITSFKILYGSLSDDRNPNLEGNGDLLQFPKGENGEPLTFTFDDRPYMEASFGISNIFKIFRVDVVQRLNYLEHPNVPSLFGRKGLGLRIKTQVEF